MSATKPKRSKAKTHRYTSLVLPKNLHKDFKALCLDREQHMEVVLEELVRDYVAKSGTANKN